MSELISHEELKRVLDYDPNTGVFTWKEKVSDKVNVGSVAGCEAKNSGGNACYSLVRVYGVLYRCHRLAWFYHYGVWPNGVVDHINQDGLDNRIDNLRDLSIKGNSRNAPLRKDNKSGVCGVAWDKAKELWLANIRVDGKTKFLGYFRDFDKAVECRLNAQKELGFYENHGRPFNGKKPEKRYKLSGVAFDKATNKWRAKIRVGSIYVHVGYFDDWFDAVCARRSAENAYFTGANRDGVVEAPPKRRYAGINGVIGVNFVKAKGLWIAYIKNKDVDKNRIHLGYHDTFEDAVVARKKAEDDLKRGIVPAMPVPKWTRRKPAAT